MVVMDLNAQTGRESMGCLSLRPSAIQIHYLGFPASTGAEFVALHPTQPPSPPHGVRTRRYIDFIIGDAVVSPPEMQHGYAEKLLMMPMTFQVCDRFCAASTAGSHWLRRSRATPLSTRIPGPAPATKCASRSVISRTFEASPVPLNRLSHV